MFFYEKPFPSCGLFIGFDCSDWVIFIKREILITTVNGLAGQFRQIESALNLCNGVFTDQVIFSIILENFFSDYGSTVPYACSSIGDNDQKKRKGYQKNQKYFISGLRFFDDRFVSLT